MPIKIPDNLPARQILEQEGVLVINEHDAIRQDIRPMRIALLNLMPEKVKTETQIARVVGSTPLQVEMTLLKTSSYTPINTSSEHMLAFYEPWEEVAQEKFDGLIVTGAPVEEIDFEEVHYWAELTEVFDWARSHVSRTFNICWGGQAALYHYYGVPKHAMKRKLSGVFEHRVATPNSVLLRGFADRLLVPVSRYTETRRTDVDKVPSLVVLAESDEAGLCLVEDRELNQVFMFNHLEYDTETLANEYRRDVEAGRDIHVPDNYFPGSDPELQPINSWRAHGHLLFANWINDMYQHAPFDIADIGKDRVKAGPAARAQGTAGA
ncbi:MAG: homoserine O-succinyltransferase [Alphaproteobacteria bacterium]